MQCGLFTFVHMKHTAKQPQSRFNAPLMSWDIFITHFHESLKQGADAQQLEKLAEDRKWKHRWNFRQQLEDDKQLIVVTDITWHIVFASSNLYENTGYSAATVNSLQWPLSQELNKVIGPQLEAGRPFASEIVNYTKNGRAYRCKLEVHPVLNHNGEQVNFIAFEKIV